ncbi:folate family ECF transporter S component [Guggenheimella bovis]
MKHFSLPLRKWIVVLALAIAGALSIFFGAKPTLIVGYYFSLAAVFLLSLSSNRVIGSIFGFLTVGAGILLRLNIPYTPDLSAKALAKYVKESDAFNSFLGSNFYWMILIGIIVGLFGGAIAEILEKDRQKLTTNRITTMAVFIALSVAINSLRVGSVSFGGFPIIYGGYVLGPIGGFIVGALADLLGFLVRPSGNAFNPIFTLTSALTGLIPVLVTTLLGEKYPKLSFIKVLIGIFIGQMITSVLMVPYFQALLYAKNTFEFYAIKALTKQLVSIPIYAFLIISMNDVLSKVITFGAKREGATR